jgi:hypothetical protein
MKLENNIRNFEKQRNQFERIMYLPLAAVERQRKEEELNTCEQ